MRQTLKDNCGNIIFSIDTVILYPEYLNYVDDKFVKSTTEVDVYFYTNHYETLSTEDKVEFKLKIADAQRIPRLVKDKKAAQEDPEKEIKDINNIVAEYLTSLATDFGLVHNKES